MDWQKQIVPRTLEGVGEYPYHDKARTLGEPDTPPIPPDKRKTPVTLGVATGETQFRARVRSSLYHPHTRAATILVSQCYITPTPAKTDPPDKRKTPVTRRGVTGESQLGITASNSDYHPPIRAATILARRFGQTRATAATHKVKTSVAHKDTTEARKHYGKQRVVEYYQPNTRYASILARRFGLTPSIAATVADLAMMGGAE